MNAIDIPVFALREEQLQILMYRYSDRLVPIPEDWRPRSDMEIEFARHMSSPIRSRYLFRRTFLARTLAAHHRCYPRDIVFHEGGKKKPNYSAPGAPPLHFSLSDTKDVVLIASCPCHPIGVDIELVEKKIEIKEMLPLIASETERLLFENHTAVNHLNLFFRLWTRKEALLKGLGHGFLAEPRNYTVLQADDFGHISTAALFHSCPMDWQVIDIPTPDIYQASLAIHRKIDLPTSR